MKALILLAGLSVGLNHPVFAQGGRGAVRENARDWKAAKKEYQAAAEALYLQQLYVQKLEKEAASASKGQSTTPANQLDDTKKQLNEVNKNLELAKEKGNQKNIKYFLSQQERLSQDIARLGNLVSAPSAGGTVDPLTEAKSKLVLLAQAEATARTKLNTEAKKIHSLVTGNEKKGINRALDLRAEVSEGGTQDWALKRLQLEAKNAATDQHHKIYDEWESVGEIKVPVMTSSTSGAEITPKSGANVAQDEAATKLRESSAEQFAAYEKACEDHKGFARAKSVTTDTNGIITTQSYAVCNDGTEIPYDLPGQDPNHKPTPAQNAKKDCDLAYAEVVKLLADGNSSAFADMVTLVDLKMAYRVADKNKKTIEEYVSSHDELRADKPLDMLNDREFRSNLTDLYQKYGMKVDLNGGLFSQKLSGAKFDHNNAFQNQTASAVALYLSATEKSPNIPQALKFNEGDAAALWALDTFKKHWEKEKFEFSKMFWGLSKRVKIWNEIQSPEYSYKRHVEDLEKQLSRELTAKAKSVMATPEFTDCFKMCNTNQVLETEHLEKVKAALAKFVATGTLKGAKGSVLEIDSEKSSISNLKLYLKDTQTSQK
jgi:hypothetical protein